MIKDEILDLYPGGNNNFYEKLLNAFTKTFKNNYKNFYEVLIILDME